jgi:hypothetical protein
MNNKHRYKFIFDIETEFNDDQYEEYQKRNLRIKKLKRILDE